MTGWVGYGMLVGGDSTGMVYYYYHYYRLVLFVITVDQLSKALGSRTALRFGAWSKGLDKISELG